MTSPLHGGCRLGGAAIGALALVVLLLGLPASAGASPPVGPPGGAAPTVSGAPKIQHVVIIVLENQLLSEVWAHGPYERYLAATYGNATNYYAACHPSAPNYIDLISAVTNQCGSDSWHNYTNTTIGDLLLADHLTYANFAEDLPSNGCSNPGGATAGLFATRHVPFLFFADVLRNQSFCDAHVLPASNFTHSVANGTLPNFSVYTPNLCDDGHNGCGGNTTNAQLTAQADAWLDGFLAPILNHTGMYANKLEKRLVQHTLFIVTWDEGVGSNSGYAVSGDTSLDNYDWCGANGAAGDAVCGGHIFTAFVSPYSVGRNFTGLASPYNVVRTVEWLFGLPHLKNAGRLDANPGFPLMLSMFSFKANGY